MKGRKNNNPRPFITQDFPDRERREHISFPVQCLMCVAVTGVVGVRDETNRAASTFPTHRSDIDLRKRE